MKPSRLTRIFALLLTLIIATGTVVAVLADITAGDVNGDGKITAFDAQMIAEKKAGLRTFSDDQAERAGVLSIQDILHMILNTPAEPTEPTEPAEPTEPSAPAVDPNAIAAVTNDGQTEYVNSVSAMISSVAADGNTQIKLLKDIANTASAITFPYSCTIDFSGHTVTTNPNSGNCIEITKAGTENQTTTIKNGTMLYNQLGLRVAQGAFMIENMKMHGSVGAAVGLRDTTNYKDINRISNSTLSSGGWGCVAFHISPEDYSNTGYTIENSTLVSYLQSGANTLTRSGVAIPGTVTLGDNVNLYTYAANFAASGHVINGLPASQVSSSATVTVNGVTYTGLKHWRSGQVGTEDKTQDSIAQVVNGTKTRYVSNVTDMAASVQSSGNTQIKLLQDITTDAPIIFDYSCTFDLNGHSVQTNLEKGNGVQVQDAGSQNQTTTIKNGTLTMGDVGIRIWRGALVLENVTARTVIGPTIAVYDNNSAYKDINRISDSTIISENYVCLTYHLANTDFSNTSFSVDNSTFISAKNQDGSYGTIFGRRDSTTTMGQIHIGENVELYSYATFPNNVTLTIPYTGNELYHDSQKADVTVGDLTYTGLNHWGTNVEQEVFKILLVGNSFSNRMGEEMVEIARQNGKELYIANLYYPGCTVKQHWNWRESGPPADAQYPQEYNIHSTLGRWTDPEVKTLNEALVQQDWDVITLQQHFSPERTVNYATALNSCLPYTKQLLDHFKTINPNAQLYWYQTWAYSTAHDNIGTEAVQLNQYNQIKAVSNYLAQESNIPQLPCGDAFQIARANPLVTADPCLSDNYHQGSTTGGRYMIACVFYETLFRESCVGSTAQPVTYKLDADLMTQLQLAAHQAVADMYGEDYAK